MSNKTVDLISSVFDPHQLLLIETAFEGYPRFREYSYEDIIEVISDDILLAEMEVDFHFYIGYCTRIAFSINPNIKLSFIECLRCDLFFQTHSVTERMRAIMENIIENNGVFIP
jgi:hypothetical protein